MDRADHARVRFPHLCALAFAVALVLAFALAPAASAYEPRSHQRLTFLAAKQLNRCLGETSIPHLSPLQVRAIANSNVGLADSNFVARLFRWSYYDPLEREGHSVGWVVTTRFNDHFRQLVAELESARSDDDRQAALGRIVSYVQLVSAPARAIPVYAPRFWRWTFTDRFDLYPLQDAELEAQLDADCSHLAQTPESFQAILAEVAADTLRAVRGPIGPLPATWEAFWTIGDAPGEFGSYGPAGNSFGRYTEFPCGPPDIHRCVLLTDDPAYVAFALSRHLAAVRGTARAMLLYQQWVARLADEPVPAEPATAPPVDEGVSVDAE
jgi:hypothetical protein